MTADPYIDRASGTLRNRLGVIDIISLRKAEADLTLAALADLGTRILPGNYDLDHLKTFHREIFGDLYDWAGEIRTVGIARTDPFCLPQHIETYSSDVFVTLAKEQHLRGLNRPEFVTRLTHYFAEISAIHPFREGNFRIQRAFLRQLGSQAGWPIDWSTLDPETNEYVSMTALRGDNAPRRDMLDRLVRD